MDLRNLIGALSDPSAYVQPVREVEVRHTHISVVFLAGAFAYKIKKPVDLGFLNFSSLEKRQHFCEEEVRLNRRLAPSVYLGVVPIVWTGTEVRMEAEGEVVEWAVKMERLPELATLESHVQRGEVGPEFVEALARKVARFHARAEAGAHISAFGRFEVVARNSHENFEQSAAHVGTTVSSAVFERLRSLTGEGLSRLRPLIDRRADQDVPRDTHGDLHLDHVYLFPDRAPPDDLVIIDCIEFNERFRFADPVADMSFLVMDLSFHGRRDLATIFADAYFRATGDDEGHKLLPFYTAYRAVVRAKVEGFELSEKEVPENERAAALARGRAHWLLALGELEKPGRRPCLILVSGLPGTGKSTLAKGLVERAGFCQVRSDVVRKELAGLTDNSQFARTSTDLYTPEWTERTYAECLRRVEMLLFEGKRVVVDANFREEKRRREFLDAARAWGVPGAVILCRAESETVRARLASRRNDPSDADWSIYQSTAETWEEPGLAARPVVHNIAADGSEEQTLSRAVEFLRHWGLQ